MNSTAVAGNETNAKRLIGPWDIWVLVLPLLGLLPLLLVQWQHLMNRPERQFFPILIAIGIYFPVRALLDQRERAKVTRQRFRAILVLLALSFLGFLIAVGRFSPWLAHVVALAFFGTWGLGRFPELPWTRPISWMALMAVTLPIPFGRDEKLIMWLQRASATACGNALDALNVPHLRNANIIEIKGKQLFVEEACSGIGSLYALLAAAALLLLLNRRSLLGCILVILSVPLWAFLGNFMRLLIIALAQEYYQRDLSQGLDHELLGVVTFGFAALSLWATDWLLAGFLVPLPPSTPEFNFAFQTINALFCWPERDPLVLIVDDEHESPEERRARLAYQQALQAEREAKLVRLELWGQPAVRWSIRTFSIAMVALGMLVAYVVFRYEPPQVLSFGLPKYSEAQLSKMPAKDALPAELDRWKLASFGQENRSTASEMGAHSLIWEYRKDGHRLLFSMDFPFRGGHALEQCYINAGWTIESLAIVKDPDPEAGEWEWRESQMVNQFGSRGFLCYSLMTDGCVPYSEVDERNRNFEIIRRLFADTSGAVGARRVFTPICYQIQMICETGRALTADEQTEVKQLFLETREILRSKIKPDP